MSIFKKIGKAFKKVVRAVTGGLFDHTHSTTADTVPAPELGFVDADTTNTTEAESEKQQLTKGKKRGKKSLKVDMTGASRAGRNIV